MNVRDSWLRRTHSLRPKLNASRMRKQENGGLTGKESEAQNWIALTCKSLPNEFDNSFHTVRADEKSKSLNMLAANTAGALADRRRLRVSMKALYCSRWLRIYVIVKQITIDFWRRKQDAAMQEPK